MKSELDFEPLAMFGCYNIHTIEACHIIANRKSTSTDFGLRRVQFP